MRSKYMPEPGSPRGQTESGGARDAFEGSHDDTLDRPTKYPRGYSESQGGVPPRHGAERSGLDDVYPSASHRWPRDDDGASAQTHRDHSPWQEPGARRMGTGYGESSGYGQTPGFGYGRGGDGDRAVSYGYQPSSRAKGPRGIASEEPRQPLYEGRGPRDYHRSDERILEEVNERLTYDPWLDASDVTVRCMDGRVQLEGQVRDRWMKHRAEDLVDACMGVRDIDNRLRVQGSRATMGSNQSDEKPYEPANTPREHSLDGSAPPASLGNGNGSLLP